jgi:hypothetical protein
MARTSVLSTGKKAQHTAKWARIMTKWLVTYSHRTGAKWNLVEFGGKTSSESRGIVDILAIRKNHTQTDGSVKKGDLFDIVLIQTKGGSSRKPNAEDVNRLIRVARHHRARAVVLANWKRRVHLDLFILTGKRWEPINADEIFG